MSKFDHDLVVITDDNQIDDGSDTGWIQVKPGQRYSIVIGHGGSGGKSFLGCPTWSPPPGVTHIFISGMGGGKGRR